MISQMWRIERRQNAQKQGDRGTNWMAIARVPATEWRAGEMGGGAGWKMPARTDSTSGMCMRHSACMAMARC